MYSCWRNDVPQKGQEQTELTICLSVDHLHAGAEGDDPQVVGMIGCGNVCSGVLDEEGKINPNIVHLSM
ncbi:MAG: hypothetical protein AAF587_38755 [Bacteroidota bacterium]